MRVIFPRGWEPTQDWLVRQHDIDLLLKDPAGDLRRGVDEAIRLFETAESETPGRRRLAQIQKEWPGLFPGEAGARVLEAIVTGQPPSLLRHDPNAEPGPAYYSTVINVFEDRTSVPADYTSTVKESGRSNRWAPRGAWEPWSGPRTDQKRMPTDSELIRLLEGNNTHQQVRAKYGLTAKQLATRLSRLRKELGPVLVRTATDQEKDVRWRETWAAIVNAETLPRDDAVDKGSTDREARKQAQREAWGLPAGEYETTDGEAFVIE